jgi:putative ABC transport system ATP-binding protein
MVSGESNTSLSLLVDGLYIFDYTITVTTFKKSGGNTMAFISFENVYKEYGTGHSLVRALDNTNFSVEKGELAVILGSSGAGKTTALNILGGMDNATRGKVIFDGNDITHWNEAELCNYRRSEVGFVFQFYNLVPNLTALENVELAAQICVNSLDAAETLKKVGLSDRMDNFPAQLSGGEQQRVSIARALAKNPKLLLCDEPTGALDYVTGKQVLQLLQDTCRKEGITVILITHNTAIVPMADKVIHFKNGKMVDMKVNAQPMPISEIEW